VSRSLAIATGILVIIVGRAGAQGESEGKRLFDEGRALSEQGKHEEACALYAKSYELEQAAGTMLNLGDCAERGGKLARAWQLFDAAAREFGLAGKPTQEKFARGRADALAPKLAKVVVRIAEPRAGGLSIWVGGRAVAVAAAGQRAQSEQSEQSEIVELLEAGPIAVEVGAPGREPFSTTVTGVVGAEVAVDVPVLRAMGGGVAPPPETRPLAERRQRGRVRIAAGVGAAGALGLGAAAVLAVSARAAYGDYKDKLAELGCTVSCDPAAYELAVPYYDRSARRADLATGLAIGGGALVVAGAVLFLTAPRERVSLAPAASGAGLTVVGRF
jgi:serine/threonine-protein kinase